MKATNINTNLINGYLGLLKNMSSDSKLELITKLLSSMKSSKRPKSSSLKALYGAFISEQSADELLKDIQEARIFNRQIEKL